MEERRRFVRLQSWLTAHYSVVGKPQPLQAVTRNTSPGGIGFLTKSRLVPGTVLDVSLEFPEQHRTVRFTGEVRWSGPLLLEAGSSSPPHAFETGVRFVTISPDDQAFLMNFAPNRLPDA